MIQLLSELSSGVHAVAIVRAIYDSTFKKRSVRKNTHESLRA
jgi:hypothetical protein